jgi:hypothetical protein
MRISRLLITVFAVILFVFATVSVRVLNSSSVGLAAHQRSNVLVADGSDPLPKPWRKLAA